MDDSITSYGVREQRADPDPVADLVEQIDLVGYAVADSGLTPGALTDLRAALDRALETQIRAYGPHGDLADIGEADMVRSPLVEDDRFLELIRHPIVQAVCARLLGDYFVLMQQNGIVNRPNAAHHQAAWHRDLPYQHFTSSRPISISALFCLDDFRAETGGTWVLPGSHKVEGLPGPAVIRRLGRPVEAPAGSILLFDSMLFHRSGRNVGAGPRRGVNNMFTLAFVAQQIDLPAALAGRHADDPALRRLLGYDTRPAASALDWRRRRSS